MFALGLSSTASAATAITNRDDCNQNAIPANDDGSSTQVALPFTLNFLGTEFSSLFVNNNGNVTLDNPMATYTPFPLADSGAQIIAPFFADVDTRGAGSGLTTYGSTTVGTRTAFCALWDGVDGVGYFSAHDDKLNKFQLLLVDRSDTGPGNFDMIFDYDQIQWETGDASGGQGGIGGTSASAGYANGTNGGNGVSFELPGSRETLSFLDSNPTTGLANNSRNSAVTGRYVFPIRNGAVTGSGSITGTVTGRGTGEADTTMPIANGVVQACTTSGFCVTTRTTATGAYGLVGLDPGSYTLTVYPPTGALNDLVTTTEPVDVASDAEVTHDIVLEQRVTPPPGTFSGSGSVGSADNPVLYWNSPVTLTVHGTAGCTGSYEAQDPSDPSQVFQHGDMTESSAGTYTAVIPPFYPSHGPVHVVVTTTCGGTPTIQAFDAYIDPSGVVVDTNGHPVAGATVSLARGDASTGPFSAVPDGDAVMSPANRQNPDVTDAQGRFGWDVTAGYYDVSATKPGCHAPGYADIPAAFSPALTIPPPVTNLVITLDCASTPPARGLRATITTPVDGATYRFKEVVRADFACVDRDGGPGIASCKGTVADGARIDTSHAGSHAFKVTAKSRDRHVVTTVVHYIVDKARTVLTTTQLRLNGRHNVAVQARLTYGPGSPLAGRPISRKTIAFSSLTSQEYPDATTLCSKAKTNSDGYARCTFSTTKIHRANLLDGYRASFAGDRDYEEISDISGVVP
ncbi:MAG TPA: nidogen-like domain-containing protein [Solirubrobacteraceae bacterium]|jgi:hypothetical protein|nr:nidogen-like domain-containing protein [Solirubrobacteraceae bacterium]